MHRLAAGLPRAGGEPAELVHSHAGFGPGDRDGAPGRRAGVRGRSSLLAGGRRPHVSEVTAISDGVDADATVLDEKAAKIEQHGSETAKLFKTRYLEPAA
jgi:hypothetical protein